MELNNIEKKFKECAPKHTINANSRQILDKYYNHEEKSYNLF